MVDNVSHAVDYPEDIEIVEKDVKLMKKIGIIGHIRGVGDGLMFSSVIN